MEVLELKELKEKNVDVYLLDILINSNKNNKLQYLSDFFNISGIDFITIENENENQKKSINSDFIDILEKAKVPYYLIDIPEYAKGYIYEEIMGKEAQLEELFDEFLTMKEPDSIKGQNLISWIFVLEEEIRELRNNYSSKVKPQWIAKKILDIIRKSKSKNIKFAHFTQKTDFKEILKIFSDLKIHVITNRNHEKSVILNITQKQEELEKWKF